MDKKEIMKTLHTAIMQVNDAMAKIDEVADELGIVRQGDTIPLQKLAYMVGKDTGVSPFCAEEVIRSAFSIIHDLDLSISFTNNEEDDDDE